MRQNNPADNEAANALLEEVDESDGHITVQNYCMLLSVLEEAQSTKNSVIAEKVSAFISQHNDQIAKGVNEDVYRALINPFATKSQELLKQPVDWIQQPLWSNFMAEEAVLRINDQIKNVRDDKAIDKIFEQIPETLRKDTRDFYAVEFRGFLLWRYAEILERDRHDYKRAAEFYRKSVEAFDVRPPHFPDGDLSYDNINWRRIRSKLSQLACERTGKNGAEGSKVSN